MNCPRCNVPVTQQDKYCPSCGLALEAARKGGSAKKPVKKEYEEASTQLVDVDEFRRYMADEGKAEQPKADLLTAPRQGSTANLAVSGPGSTGSPNLAQPVQIAPSGSDTSSPPGSSEVGDGADHSRGVANTEATIKPAARGADTEFLPTIKRAPSQKVFLAMLVLLVVALFAFLIFRNLNG